MSIKASQIVVFVATAGAAVALLSAARAGFKDQADAAFWNSLSGAGEEVAELRAEEAETLATNPTSIDEAMREYAAKGRDASPKLKAAESEPAPPLTGWIQHPDYAARVRAAKEFSEQHAAAAAEAAATEEQTGEAGAAEAAE